MTEELTNRNDSVTQVLHKEKTVHGRKPFNITHGIFVRSFDSGPWERAIGLFVASISLHLVLKEKKTDVGKGNYSTTLQVTSISFQEISPVDISGVAVHVVR